MEKKKWPETPHAQDRESRVTKYVSEVTGRGAPGHEEGVGGNEAGLEVEVGILAEFCVSLVLRTA